MFKRLFGKGEKQKEEERLRKELDEERARREQTVADQRNALKLALRPLQSTVDGVPTEAGIKESTERLQATIKILDQEKAGQDLTKEEAVVLERLKAHAQGVKVDPRRYQATFTEEKQLQLKELELRSVVSEEIAAATKGLQEARQKQKAFTVGQRLHQSCKTALEKKQLGPATKALDGMTKAYTKSGFTRTEEITKELTRGVWRRAAEKLERVWRGHEARKAFRDVSWKKDKFRIEAQSLFVALDETGDGTLSISELRIGLARAGYSKANVRRIVEMMDEDGSGEVDGEEFISSFRTALMRGGSSLAALHEEVAGAAAGKGVSGEWARSTDFKVGDKVWFRRQDGTRTESKIVNIDYGQQPPWYTVRVDGGERGTEGQTLEPEEEEDGDGAGNQDSVERVMDTVQLGTTVYMSEEAEDAALLNRRKRVFLEDQGEEEKRRWETQGAQLHLPKDGGGSMGEDSTGATEHVFGELHFAAKKGDVIRVWALVNKAKIPVDSLTTSDSAAIHFAAWEGHQAVISTLVALGAEVNRDTGAGYSPVHCAAANNRHKCIRELARLRADVDRPASRSLSTALHWAARNGHIESLETLVEVGATVDSRDWGKNTPVMYAARHGRVAALERLVELKADLRAQNADGKNALFHAAETGQTAACIKLVELGLGATEVLLYGGTAADFADSRGHSDCAAFLRGKEPKVARGRRTSMFGLGIGDLGAPERQTQARGRSRASNF